MVTAQVSKFPTVVTKLVTHQWPDDDAWLCLWMAYRFIPQAFAAEVVFVNAGTTLEGSENDVTVLHFDTGHGEFDHHGKEGLGRTCSAAMLAEWLGLSDDAGLQALLELTTSVDNAEKVSPTSIHFLIEGYPRLLKGSDGKTDWKLVQERVFELYEIIYGQERDKVQKRGELNQYARWRALRNGIRICTLFGRPDLRDPAFEAGAAVVIWTKYKGKNKFDVGVSRNRNFPSLHLDHVVAWLRNREAAVRRADTSCEDLFSMGKYMSWFLHDSHGLILHGGKTWTPTAEERTMLTPREIEEAIIDALMGTPKHMLNGSN